MAIFESVRGTLVQLERSKFVCDACLTSHREISNWVSKYFVSFAFLRSAIGLKKKLALLSPPIRCKIKTNCDLVTRVFPRFWLETCFYLEFSLALCDILLYSYWLMELLWFWLYDIQSILTLSPCIQDDVTTNGYASSQPQQQTLILLFGNHCRMEKSSQVSALV